MNDAFETCQATCTFRFGASGNVIRLTEDQLNRFPYLRTLTVPTDEAASARNDHDEYVLNDPFHYDYFIAIFRSVMQNQPHVLFTELSHDLTVFNILQLYEYLRIKPLPLPILQQTKLVRSKAVHIENDQLKPAQFRRATLSEARNQAAQLIVAISKNEYNLNNEQTRNTLFSLLQSIFASPEIFNFNFRYHTLTIAKRYCSPLFSASQEMTRNGQVDSWIYIHDDDEPLPEDFTNALAWKEDKPMPETFRNALGCTWDDLLLEDFLACLKRFSAVAVYPVHLYQRPLIYTYKFMDQNHGAEVFDISERDQEQKNHEEAQSARSGRFNTLPERPTVDRFKHRPGRKTQQHR